MCGIVGLIDHVVGRVTPELLFCMRDVMIPRGPDGEGHYIDGPIGMAMRRLSVIDLEGGGQPFYSHGRQVVAFQNGEIYNYRQLRRELESYGHCFVSSSDTEVLAHGYVAWGMEGLLDRLDGMYAIAILDKERRELHLARDRFGEKPLFYAFARERFAYSSNLVVLAALPWVESEVNPRSLDRYLALHYVPGDATIVQGIHRVLPGEHLIVPIDAPVPERRRYYKPPLSQMDSISDDTLAQQIEEAVSSRLVADVPVGVFLSGGLDSSIVAAVAARKQPHIATFSMGFPSRVHDESNYAAKVAKLIGSTHHHFLFDENSFQSLLPQVAEALDEPIGDQAILPVFWLCREARRYVTVVLAGEGADEVFAGYSYYHSFAGQINWRDRIKIWLGKISADSNQLNRLVHNHVPVTPSGFPLLSDPAERERLIGNSWTEPDQWERELLEWFNDAVTPLQRATAADLATWLADDLLVKFDRMAMAHSLEGRAPYLHPEVVKTGLNLPGSYRIRGNVCKYALRKIAARWLPPEIFRRSKHGFVLPMGSWLAQWLNGHRPVKEYFIKRGVPGLDMNAVAKIAEEELSAGVRRERLLFALILLVEWYHSFCQRRREYRMKYKLYSA